MGSKLAFLLSLFFVIGIMGMAGDLASIQVIQTSLDAASITAARSIAIHGGINQQIIASIEKECGGHLISLEEEPVQVGDIFHFMITKEYQPFVLSSSPLTVKVERSTVIGYLD